MAKYVRTKDGRIFERNKVSVVNENGVEIVMFGIDKEFVEKTRGKPWNCGTNVIVKQSDNIEELCDNFLVEYTNGEHMMFHDFYHLKRHHDFYGQDYHHVAGRYGCIWVARQGLIYVAKMNKEGELELI